MIALLTSTPTNTSPSSGKKSSSQPQTPASIISSNSAVNPTPAIVTADTEANDND
jgi:hypothetical protein